jgi:hypothetical protein
MQFAVVNRKHIAHPRRTVQLDWEAVIDPPWKHILPKATIFNALGKRAIFSIFYIDLEPVWNYLVIKKTGLFIKIEVTPNISIYASVYRNWITGFLKPKKIDLS